MFWKSKCCPCCHPATPANPSRLEETDAAHRDFLYKAYSEFQNVIRFGDAKAAGVVVLLGLGLADLLKKAPQLSVAYREHSGDLSGCVSSIAFWLALPIAVVVVASVMKALFPQLRASDPSLFFFGDIQKRATAGDFISEVRALPERGLADEVAKQVWQLSVIASSKMNWVKKSYYAVLGFLGLWAIARIAFFIAER